MIRTIALRIGLAFLWVISFVMFLRLDINYTNALPLERQYCKSMELREKQGVRDIAWSPSRRFLASTSFQSVNIWDIKTGKVFKNLTNDNFIQIDSLAWSPDAKLIATLGNGITVLEAESGKGIDIFRDGQNAANGGNVDWNFEGNKLAFIRIGENGHQVEVWDRGSGNIKKIGLPLVNISSVKWSPTQNTLAISDGDRLQIWDVASGKILADLRPLRPTWAIAWNTDGHLLAGGNANYATNETTIQIWDTSIGVPSTQLVRVLDGHTGGVISVAWKPQIAILASGSQDSTIRIWDVNLGKTLFVLKDHKSAVTSLKWSRDGAFLASADNSGVIIIWQQKDSCTE